MTWTLHDAVWATVAYAAIFDYPLTKEEIRYWLIYSDGVKNIPVRNVVVWNGYYGVSKRVPQMVQRRLLKEQIAEKKWKLASSAVALLQHIPTIQLIGVSGGLAMNNAEREDDIDLFFIVSPKTIWITRLLVLFVLEVMGRRRRFGVIHEQDLLCANMFLSHDGLLIPKAQQDLYSAHEILQLTPLFDRGGTYRTFLQANHWVKRFLPNAWKGKTFQATSLRRQVSGGKLHNLGVLFLRSIDLPAKFLELTIMKRHKTTEVTTDTALQFHPHDARIFVKTCFLKALKRKNIPLDSMFFFKLQ